MDCTPIGAGVKQVRAFPKGKSSNFPLGNCDGKEDRVDPAKKGSKKHAGKHGPVRAGPK